MLAVRSLRLPDGQTAARLAGPQPPALRGSRVNREANINELVRVAFSKSVWISNDTKADLARDYPEELMEQLDSILFDSCWPSDPWVTSESLEEAVKKVEPTLKEKYPQLDDQSMEKILDYACFQWK